MEIGPTGLLGQLVQSPVEEDSKLELVCATIQLQSTVASIVLALEQKPKVAIHNRVQEQLVMSYYIIKVHFASWFVTI